MPFLGRDARRSLTTAMTRRSSRSEEPATSLWPVNEPTNAGALAFGSHGLFFREWRSEDAETMVALFDTDQMNRWTPLASPFTASVAREYIDQARQARTDDTVQLAILLAPGTAPVGEVIVFPSDSADEVELAYAVGAEHQGQRVATRAVLAALELARTRGSRRALLTIAIGNRGSAAVARATGFAETGASLRERRRKGFVLQMQTWSRDV